LHDETIEALADAGVFRMRVPARFGGDEVNTATMGRTIAEIALSDGAAAWNTGVWSMCAWLPASSPDHVQDDVVRHTRTYGCAVC